jgi:hypothetical protein
MVALELYASDQRIRVSARTTEIGLPKAWQIGTDDNPERQAPWI